MTDLERMKQVHKSLDLYDETRDIEHLYDVERILEYDGISEDDKYHGRK